MCKSLRFEKRRAVAVFTLATVFVAAAARVALAQEEIVETIAENPNSSAAILAAIAALPHLLTYLNKRSETVGATATSRLNTQASFAQNTIDGLYKERDRLLDKIAGLEQKNAALDKEKDEALKEFWRLSAQNEVLSLRVGYADDRIKGLSMRLAKLGHPVTGDYSERKDAPQ